MTVTAATEPVVFITPNQQSLQTIGEHFDQSWYETTYPAWAKRAVQLNVDNSFDYYLYEGGLLGHDPNPTFSESAFRYFNPVCAAALARDASLISGFAQSVQLDAAFNLNWQGRAKVRNRLRTMSALFDDDYYIERNRVTAETLSTYPTVFDHYLRNCVTSGASPNRHFDEQKYRLDYPVIASEIRQGSHPSGFMHYLMHDDHKIFKASPNTEHSLSFPESEREASLLYDRLESKYPDAVRQQGLVEYRQLSSSLQPTKFYGGHGQNELKVVVPDVDPDIMFGGYAAFWQFIKLVEPHIPKIQLIVRNRATSASFIDSILRFCDKYPELAGLAQTATTALDRVEIGPNTHFLCYSARCVAFAKHVSASHYIGTTPNVTHFVQDYEPDFYPAGSRAAYSESQYDVPHTAIINSPTLANFFQERHLGVFATPTGEAKWPHYVFQNPILFEATTQLSPPQKRMVVYARPENHAHRNLFAMTMVAIEKSIENGLLGDYEIYGVGRLGKDCEVELSTGTKVKLLPRLSIDEYRHLLDSCDIGISMITSSHPGLVHFEMARRGLMTITNTTTDRDAESLTAVSRNLIPTTPSIEAIMGAIDTAQSLTHETESRLAGAADIDFPSDWQTSLGEVASLWCEQLEKSWANSNSKS